VGAAGTTGPGQARRKRSRGSTWQVYPLQRVRAAQTASEKNRRRPGVVAANTPRGYHLATETTNQASA